MSAARTLHNPGSEKAINQGCICPAESNHHGAGVRDPVDPEDENSERVAVVDAKGEPVFDVIPGCTLHDYMLEGLDPNDIEYEVVSDDDDVDIIEGESTVDPFAPTDEDPPDIDPSEIPENLNLGELEENARNFVRQGMWDRKDNEKGYVDLNYEQIRRTFGFSLKEWCELLYLDHDSVQLAEQTLQGGPTMAALYRLLIEYPIVISSRVKLRDRNRKKAATKERNRTKARERARRLAAEAKAKAEAEAAPPPRKKRVAKVVIPQSGN